MNTNKIINVANEISSACPEALSEVILPVAENIGKAVGTVTDLFNTLLTPFEILNKAVSLKKENFLVEYEDALKKIPEEKVCPANLSVIAPMLDHLKFKITEDELRLKYATLISTASNADCQTKPLLSFDNVLNQLSPYEIQLMEQLFKSIPEQVYPMASIKKYNGTGFQFMYKHLPGISFKQLSLNTLAVMISNLNRLGLVIIDTENYVEPEIERYKFITESQYYINLQEECVKEQLNNQKPYPSCSLHKESFVLSNFGISFVQTILI